MLYNAVSPFTLLDEMLPGPLELSSRACHDHLPKRRRSNASKPSHLRLADQPAVDVTETEQQVSMAMNLPGLTRDQITIDFDSAKNQLTVGYAQQDKLTTAGSNEDDEYNHIEEEEAKTEASEQALSKDKQANTAKSTTSWTRLYRERPDYTGFSRSFAFQDPMNVEKASASMENGVLTLTIPKMVQKTTARISIR
ncbi:hypothetical protein CXG81DRAFT_16249 [Caulochytrium protostelioides]|uniref:SHSP domain-containing protein n=1 Tax=Caulochytrium protostelioides TaxID=1555241 RepID=A0A4P9XFB3_9FUNG|nr:hypothetical protein CXG81DRAFT_16249 [Caulochytrium protostelioides]|eukprot:RKP04267.1 hypothetical protein CXG81DRAFT_16249 [Caulochytrium protostelioides]